MLRDAKVMGIEFAQSSKVKSCPNDKVNMSHKYIRSLLLLHIQTYTQIVLNTNINRNKNCTKF